MVIITKYRLVCSDNKYHLISRETPNCPDCGGPLRHRDFKTRKAIEANGEVRYYLLRRFICLSCGAWHLELPDTLVPHKHYSRQAIESALADPKSACYAENSTIYRWSKEREKKLAQNEQNNPASQD